MNINTISEKQVDYKSYKLPVRLYPSNMLIAKDGKLSFHAKTMFRNKINMEDIAKDLIVTGVLKNSSADEIVYIWEKINAAVIDRVLNGSIVDAGIGTVYARLNGSFESRLSEFNPDIHYIDLGFRNNKDIKELASHVIPVIAQGNEIVPQITSILDIASQKDDTLTPKGDIVIKGKNLLIAGTNEDVGLYFVNTSDNSEAKVALTKLTKNSRSELICDIPDLAPGTYTIVIKTQKSATAPTKLTCTSGYEKILTVN